MAKSSARHTTKVPRTSVASEAAPEDQLAFSPPTSTATSPAELAYQRLRKAIISGEILADTRLVEETVARQLGTSRTPVREAIFKLESERLVRRDSRGGAIVSTLTPEEIEEVYAVRSALEGLSVRLASRTMLPRDHVRLEHIQARLDEAAESERFDDLTVLDLHFHNVILRSTRNKTLIGFMEQIHDSLRRVDTSTLAYPGRAAEAMHEHRLILSALKAGNARQAEQIARKHIESALDVRLLMNLSDEIASLDLEELVKLKAQTQWNRDGTKKR